MRSMTARRQPGDASQSAAQLQQQFCASHQADQSRACGTTIDCNAAHHLFPSAHLIYIALSAINKIKNGR